VLDYKPVRTPEELKLRLIPYQAVLHRFTWRI
jgi:hypothetical protein